MKTFFLCWGDTSSPVGRTHPAPPPLSYQQMTVGQLSNPTLGSADFARVPLGAVPGLTWSLSNDCLYDSQLEDTPLTINTISDGMDCVLSDLHTILLLVQI